MKYYRKTTHAIYDIKYHICWITKYRYQILKGDVAIRTRELIRQICANKLEVRIIVGSVGPDHIHLLISAPPNESVSKIVQYLKGTTSRKLQQEFPALRKRYWGQHLWARGYFAITSGTVTDEIWLEYIRKQREQVEMREPGDFQIVVS